MLKGAEPTLQNKRQAMFCSGFHKKFLEEMKIKIEHPEMNSYQRVAQCVRATNGFGEWELLHILVVQ